MANTVDQEHSLKQTTSWSTLPDECLLRIFQFLDPASLQAVSQTNKKNKTISSDKKLLSIDSIILKLLENKDYNQSDLDTIYQHCIKKPHSKDNRFDLSNPRKRILLAVLCNQVKAINDAICSSERSGWSLYKIQWNDTQLHVLHVLAMVRGFDRIVFRVRIYNKIKIAWSSDLAKTMEKNYDQTIQKDIESVDKIDATILVEQIVADQVFQQSKDHKVTSSQSAKLKLCVADSP